MNAHVSGRGGDLVEGGRRIGAGPQWLARLWSGGVQKILDRIDRGLQTGSIMATLPGGETRLLGGRNAGFDAVVDLKKWRALLRLATGGSVGWYQAWAAGEWDSPDPVPLFALFMANATALGGAARAHGPWRLLSRVLHRLNSNSRAGSLKNIHAHYDLGNDFYRTWLGETMIYSSALYSELESGPNAYSQFVTELDCAQSGKVAAIIERLGLAEGDKVLEIGCGWGTLAAFMASHQGVHVDAISLSDEQLAYARARWKVEAGSVDFRKQDYRDVHGRYDAIASVEMVEAVGRDYWPDFFDCVARNLRSGGRAGIQYISIRDEIFEHYAASADFIQTYVFPGGMLIKESEFRALAAERGLSWEDQHNFGGDYARTLREWRCNFDLAVEEGRLPSGFDERFVQLWRYYLMYCEGGFLGSGIEVSQVTLVKG
ncbi:cyclopropane-fatty-acyl-phospholipid synthase family protein [Novosphingobium sp. P6W]|uniref:SAM-dependent methyltransferase n=1 Tax=Novosphingobium sp. P6W TaxID=1609758 RepID=UPI0005C2C031|nr:cyclopropane-fatty-acyl-phospholipid synthase family protein [Novosphingobium sp. P6W]AXB76884.1 class I SAM-dependent methyltransferase [Novosphingobium sp. P6W]KIS33271.1 cyclopropane-fatty-acyl-phospholipid synthase [Novosphingobium sp. P6W]